MADIFQSRIGYGTVQCAAIAGPLPSFGLISIPVESLTDKLAISAWVSNFAGVSTGGEGIRWYIMQSDVVPADVDLDFLSATTPDAESALLFSAWSGRAGGMAPVVIDTPVTALKYLTIIADGPRFESDGGLSASSFGMLSVMGSRTGSRVIDGMTLR